MAGQNNREIEALYVSIYAEFKPLLDAQKAVGESVVGISQSLNTLGASFKTLADAVNTSCARMVQSIQALGTAASQLPGGMVLPTVTNIPPPPPPTVPPPSHAPASFVPPAAAATPPGKAPVVAAVDTSALTAPIDQAVLHITGALKSIDEAVKAGTQSIRATITGSLDAVESYVNTGARAISAIVRTELDSLIAAISERLVRVEELFANSSQKIRLLMSGIGGPVVSPAGEAQAASVGTALRGIERKADDAYNSIAGLSQAAVGLDSSHFRTFSLDIGSFVYHVESTIRVAMETLIEFRKNVQVPISSAAFNAFARAVVEDVAAITQSLNDVFFELEAFRDLMTTQVIPSPIAYFTIHVERAAGRVVHAIDVMQTKIGTFGASVAQLNAAVATLPAGAAPPPAPPTAAAVAMTAARLAQSVQTLNAIDMDKLDYAIGELTIALGHLSKVNLDAFTTSLSAMNVVLRQKFAEITSILDLGTAFSLLTGAIAGLTVPPGVITGLTGLVQPLKDLVAIDIAKLDKLGQALGRINTFTNMFTSANLNMNLFSQNVNRLIGVLGRFGGIDPATQLPFVSDRTVDTLRSISLGLRGVSAGVKGIGVADMKKFGDQIDEMITHLSQFGRISDAVRDKISRIGNAMRGMTSGLVGITTKVNMGTLETQLDLLIPQLNRFAGVSALTTSMISALGQGLNSLSRALVRLNALDMTKVEAQIKLLIDALLQFDAVAGPTIANIERLAKALAMLSSASRGLTGAGVRSATAAVSGVKPAASTASSAVDDLTGKFANLGRGAAKAVPELNQLRFGLAAFAGVGLFAFAKFDDSLQRTVARMMLQNEELRNPGRRADVTRGLSMELTEMSSKTITGAVDLAKGFEVLASAGVESMQHLQAAEDFAVASGMKMDVATKKLIATHIALGRSMVEPAENLKNLTELSDIFVHMSHQMGVTEERLATSMGGRFLSAMKNAKLSLTEGVALLGVYTKALPQLQHEEVGTLASYGIMELTKAAATHSQAFKELGVTVYDQTTGHMRPMIGIIEDLTNKLGPMGTEANRAREIISGMGSRALAALDPLRGRMDIFRMFEAEARKAGGATKLVADMIRDSFHSQIRILWNNIYILAEAVGQRLAPAFALIGRGVAALSAWFRSLNPAVQSLIVLFVGLTLAIKPLIALMAYMIGVVTVAPIMALASAFSWLFRMWMAGNFSVTILSMRALVGLFGILAMPVNLLVGVFKSLWGMIAGFVSAVGSFFVGLWGVIKSLYNAISGVVSFLMMVGGWVVKAFDVMGLAIGAVFYGLYVAVKAVFGFLTSGFAAMKRGLQFLGDTLETVVRTIGSFLWSTFKSLMAGLVGLLVNLVSFAFGVVTMFLLLIPALALVGAVAGMIGAGIATVAKAMSGTWDRVKEGWADTSAAISDKMADVGNSTVAVWERARGRMDEFADSTANFVRKLAGFFWNFGFNVQVIFEWVGRNWRMLITDMGNLGLLLIENMGHNFKIFGLLIVQLGLTSWRKFWELFEVYASPIFGWMIDNWQNILVDMGTLFKTFLRNLVDNFREFLPVIWQLVKSFDPTTSARAAEVEAKWLARIEGKRASIDASIASVRQQMTAGTLDEEEGTYRIKNYQTLQRQAIVEMLAKAREEMESFGPGPAISAAFAKMKGPFEGLDVDAMKTKIGDLSGAFGKSNEGALRILGETAGTMGVSIGNAFKSLRTPFQGFVAQAGAGLVDRLGAGDLFDKLEAIGKRTEGISGYLATAGVGLGRMLTTPIKTLPGLEFLTGDPLLARLNLDVPDDAFERMKDMVRRTLGVISGEDQGGDVSGKFQPGVTFKQISTARYMVGGPQAESLDYEQLTVMKAIDQKLGDLVKAANRKESKPAEDKPAPAEPDTNGPFGW